MLRAGHAPWGMAGPGFHAQRIFELAVAMLEAHGLTLPQETEPLWGLDRNEKLSWRQRELAAIRRRFRLASRAWLDELNSRCGAWNPRPILSSSCCATTETPSPDTKRVSPSRNRRADADHAALEAR